MKCSALSKVDLLSKELEYNIKVIRSSLKKRRLDKTIRVRYSCGVFSFGADMSDFNLGRSSGEERTKVMKSSFLRDVAELRKSMGLSQSEVAKRAGIHQTAIARFESGESNPSLETVFKIVIALDHSIRTCSLKSESEISEELKIESIESSFKWNMENE